MSVRVASTANITSLSGFLTIDGVTVVEGDLVLLKDQTTGTQNGVYVATSGAWSRDTNLLAIGSNAYNVLIYVRNGTVNFGKTYQCVTTPGIVGTNNLLFGIYNNNYRFMWSSTANGNPVTGQQLDGVIGGSTVYDNATNGLRLTSTTNNQTGYVSWNLVGFDFTKDFRLSVSFYQASGADGVQFGVGGSSAFTNGMFTVNGALGFSYNTYTVNQNDNFTINGANTGNTISFHLNVTYTNKYITSTMIVKTYGTKRVAFVYTGSNNSADNSLDVTTWVPTGTWIGVSARTGAINANHYTNFVSLEYI